MRKKQPTTSEPDKAEDPQKVECETCQDTGEVTGSGYVYAGEPHRAEIETVPCPDCSKGRNDDQDRDDDN